MKKIMFFLSVIWASAGYSQALTTDIQVNTLPVNGVSSVIEIPIISMSENGKVAISWTHKPTSTTMFKVYSRTYDENNIATSSTQSVVNTTSSSGLDESSTRVAMDHVGNYIIVYNQAFNTSATSPFQSRIYYHRFNANGTPNGPRVLVDNGVSPDIDIAPDGTFNVSYVKGHYYMPDNAVFVKRYNSAGTALGSPIVVDSYPSTSGNGYYRAHVRSANNNNFTVCYQMGNVSNSVNVKTYNGTTSTSSQYVDGFVRTRNFVVKPDSKIVATSVRQSGNNPNTYKATTSRFGGGSPLQQQDLSIYFGSNLQYLLKGNTVGSNNNGDYVIAYPKWDNNIYQGIYLQQYTNTDAAVGPAYPVSDIDNLINAVSIDVGACEYTVTWQKAGNIYYRRFKLASSTAINLESYQDSYCAGDALTFMAEFTNGSSGITTHSWQVQECDSTGNLIGSPLFTIDANGVPSSYTLPATLNLPCNKYYNIQVMAGNSVCPGIAYANKRIYIRCTPTLSAADDKTICSGDSANFNFTTSDWPIRVYNGTALVATFNSNPIILTPTSTTTYTFEAGSLLVGACRTRETATVTLTDICPVAAYNFVTIGQTYTNVTTPYGPLQLTQVCANANGTTPVLINGGSSQDDTRYGIKIEPWDPETWTPTASPIYDSWISTTLPVPATDININSLSGNDMVPGQIYLVTLYVGFPYHSVNGLFRINALPTLDAGDDQPVCAGDIASISVTTTNWPVNVYNGSTLIGSYSSNQTISVSPSSTTTYTISTTNASNCYAQDQVTVTVNTCAQPSFVFNTYHPFDGINEVESQFGTQKVYSSCLPYPIDGSASTNETSYSIYARPFDIELWAFNGPAVIDAVFSGQVGTIDLATVASNNFTVGTIYLVELKVFPSGNSIYKFFRPLNCSWGIVESTDPVTETDTSTVATKPTDGNPTVELSEIDKDKITPNADDTVKIYPNPTDGEFTIAFSGIEVQKVIVYDILGNIVFEQESREATSDVLVNLTDVQQGIYTVHIISGKDTIQKKVVKN